MLAENMKATTEGVLAGRQARTAILRAIAENTQNTVARWQENREAERSRRGADTNELLSALSAGRAALKGEVSSLRQEAVSALEEMGKARMERVADLRIHLCGDVQTKRKRLREWLFQQGKTRSSGASLLRSELYVSRKNAENTVNDLRRKSKQFLINTRYIRELKNKELNRSLHASMDAMRLSLEGIRFAMVQKRLATKADLAQARNEWQKTAIGGLTGLITATDMPVTAKIPIEKPVVMETVPQATEHLGDKIFAYVAVHPDGVRVREIEEQLSVNRFKLMRALRSLTEEGKVQKEAGLYFAR